MKSYNRYALWDMRNTIRYRRAVVTLIFQVANTENEKKFVLCGLCHYVMQLFCISGK